MLPVRETEIGYPIIDRRELLDARYSWWLIGRISAGLELEPLICRDSAKLEGRGSELFLEVTDLLDLIVFANLFPGAVDSVEDAPLIVVADGARPTAEVVEGVSSGSTPLRILLTMFTKSGGTVYPSIM